jgi:hypothetical protein
VPRVLGIDVDDSMIARWASWVAPAVQPFVVERAADWPTVDAGPASTEVSDTYGLWYVDDALERIWLDEPTFAELSRADRTRLVHDQVRHRRGAVPTVRGWSDLVDPAVVRAQADGHRFVWWPSLLAPRPTAILERVVARSPSGRAPALAPSRHREVPAATWKASAQRVPGARAVAGTFASGSGPNCFGTVLGAAGVLGALDERVVREPFEDWLATACRPIGRDRSDDGAPGTVLLWRNRDGLAEHAAITLGGGWAFQKGSDEWWTPRVAAPLAGMMKGNRVAGWRLERHRIR